MDKYSSTATNSGDDPQAIDRRLAESIEPINSVVPQGCESCDAKTASADELSRDTKFIYAIGKIEPRFPKVSVEKELAQAIGRAETAGQTDKQALHAALALRENRYLARHLCWVLTIQGVNCYILRPRDPSDFDLLVQSLSYANNPMSTAVVGIRGPVADVGYCNGLLLPIVGFDQIYTFDRAAIIGAIPRPKGADKSSFTAAAEELFDRVIQIADNAGATDEHRALNYLAMRYSAIYHKVAEEYNLNCSLDGVETVSSRLSSSRKVIDVVLTFTERTVGFTKKYFVRVDATDQFPFLVSKLAPYYSR